MLASFVDGLRRVATAPAVWLGVYAVTLAAAVPAGVALHESIASHLGSSATAAAVADGVDTGWWAEFADDATGIARTFGPEVIGFAAVLANLSGLADRRPPAGALAGLVAAYVAVWAFLLGGVLDRLARARPVRSAGFFAACGVHVWRFARLAVVASAAYGALFGLVHPWLLDSLYGTLTRDLTVERDAALVRLVLYALFAVAVAGVTLVLDYAKIRIVVEDRRSVIGALVAAVRFVRRRPLAVTGLYGLNLALAALVMAAYAAVAPGAGTAGAQMWAGFAVGQAYIAARLFAKLTFYASETAYFQRQLAHATYVARPLTPWPDSPAAEAVGGDAS